VSDGTNKPHSRCARPAILHLQAMDQMCRGHMLADVSAILGSFDIVWRGIGENAKSLFALAIYGCRRCCRVYLALLDPKIQLASSSC
jgi:hypothetical protein